MAQKTILEIIKKGAEMGASDVHFTVFRPPLYRINGALISLPEDEPLTADDTRRLGEEIMPNDRIKDTLLEHGQADFSNSFAGVGRVRVNLYVQRGSYAAAIRLIPIKVPQLSSLGLPPTVTELAGKCD
jgi:twitching motility protein PilT